MKPELLPKLGKMREIIEVIMKTTCEDLEYEYIIPADMIEKINTGLLYLHHKLWSIIDNP